MSRHAGRSSGLRLNLEHQDRAFDRICRQVIPWVLIGVCCGLTFQVEGAPDQVDQVGLLHQ